VKRIALLLLCVAVWTGSVFGATRLIPSEKKSLELSPAVVLVDVSYQVTVKFQFPDMPEPKQFDIPYDATGSGYIYRPDGYLVTNGHVVQDANQDNADAKNRLYERIRHEVITADLVPLYKKQTGRDIDGTDSEIEREFNLHLSWKQEPVIRVYLANKTYYQGEIKAYSPPIDQGGKDVAIIKADGNNLPTVRLGDSNNVHIQEAISVIGYPAAASKIRLDILNNDSLFIPTVTNGHVSAVKADYKGMPVLQSDAAVSPGNSGGPAFNEAGEVIGMTTFGPSGAVGLNFFVPINTALEFVHSVGVPPQQGLFDKLWADALDTYDAGKCEAAKPKLQSVLNVMPNEPDAQRLVAAAEKCASEEGVMGRAMDGSSVLLYGAVGVVVVMIALLVMMRKGSPKPAAAVATGSPQVAPPPYVPPGVGSGTRVEPPAPAPERSFGTVQVTAGSLSGKRFPITKAGLLIGTDASKCQIVVSEDNISREHAWIVPVENSVVVIDRGSTNGTYINSVESPRVSKVGLQNGDRVYLGKKGSVVLTYFSS